LADATTMATLAAKGPRTVMVYGYIETPPEAVTVNAASGITRPQQLAGKSVATVEAGPIWILWPVVARHMGLAPNAVHFLSVAGDAKWT
jgi:ABC-type nitrate/sulfonate/bicarbonate transport system substrate-binding protein